MNQKIHKSDRTKLIEVFMQKNSQLNLSAIRDEEGIFVKHICDALAVQDAFSFEKKKSLIDV